MHTASILSVCALVATFSTVQAVPKYAKLIPNGNGVAGVTAVGHTDPNAGGALNAFGKAFAAAGDSWTEALCKADSDGDGQTNGEELGDPCCTWKVGATPGVASGATDPGSDKSKLDDAALTAARALCKGGSAAGPATVKPADGASNATPALTPGAPAAAPGAAPSAAPGAAPAAAPAPAGAAGATTSGSDGYDWVPIDQMNKTKSGGSSATTPSTSTSGGTSGAASSSTNSSKNSTSAAMATPLAGNSLMQVVAATVVGIVALAL